MIAVDIETSGLDPRSASILSLGAVDTDDPTNQFYDECRVWDGAHISSEALAVNGFTHEEAVDPSRKSEADLITSFVAWATDRPQNRTIVAHNVFFDLGFIDAACRRARIESPIGKRTLDIHTLVWLHMQEHGTEPPTDSHHSILTLDRALSYVGLSPEPKPHNALTGALSHAEVFSRIAYNRNIIPDFSTFPLPWQTT